MKILVVGNSNVGTLVRAYSSVQNDKGHEFCFFSVPGGTGPALRFRENVLELIPGSEHAVHKAYSFPAGGFNGEYKKYDVIVVSALGYICGGYSYDYSIMTRNYTILDEVIEGFHTRFVSLDEQKFLFYKFLERQSGFRFLRDLLQSDYSGKIIIQKFPRLSEACINNSSWKPSLRIKNIDVMYSRYLNWLDEYIAGYSKYGHFKLLDDPVIDYVNGVFTPIGLMESDGAHANLIYGKIIFEQIFKEI